MNLWESSRIALQALAANKLRAALTMLGIIIGVGAVITLMSSGSAVERYVTDQFRSIGSNLLFVMPGNFDSQRGGPGASSSESGALTNADAASLLDPMLAPDVLAIGAELSRAASLNYRGERVLTSVSGVTPGYFGLRSLQVAGGRLFDDNEQVAASRVDETISCVIPNPLLEAVELFGIPAEAVTRR